MGKPTGFLEYERRVSEEIAPLERIKNFNEFHIPLPLEKQQLQGARCMACGVPFCQYGKMINGMASGCPLNNLCPEWNDLVYTGNWEQAYNRLMKTHCFPEFTSRVCPALCEAACTCNLNGDPVSTKENERAIIERAYETGLVKAQPPKVRTGKKVAVIGSGPSGLAVAMQLNRRGHEVTVFERNDRLGGLLRYGIPNYRLPKDRLDEDINAILKTGVEVKQGLKIGVDITIQELREQYDAVLITIGASTDKKLGLPGEDADGVLSAVQFLRSVGKDEIIDLTGKEVVVIGGGNVSMDAVRTAKRLGAKKVSILYRRRRNDMTALPGEIEGAVAEGIEIVTLKAPASLDVGEDHKIHGIYATPQMISAIKDGRASVKPTGEPDVYIPCDILIKAIGQDIESGHFEKAGIPVSRGKIVTLKSGAFENMPGVFAGGDCSSGPASVIKAIAAAKVVAANIDEYLGYHHEITSGVEIPEASLKDKTPCGRVNLTERDACERVCDFNAVENCMTEKEAKQEAGRCLRCDHFGYGIFKGGRSTLW